MSLDNSTFLHQSRILLISFFCILVAGAWLLLPSEWLELSFLRAQRAELQNFTQNHRVFSVLCFGIGYIVVTALSLPGATLLTLAAGAVFHFLIALAVVSLASTIGATLAFLLARYLFADFFRAKYPRFFDRVDQGFQTEGTFYLFALRLVPAFPFFLVNILMGLTAIPVRKYFVVSQIGMLPGTIAYVNAGSQLASIESSTDILSFRVLGAFAVLGLLPLVLRRGIAFARRRQLHTHLSHSDD